MHQFFSAFIGPPQPTSVLVPGATSLKRMALVEDPPGIAVPWLRKLGGEVANRNGGCGASKIGTRLSELVRGACKATKTTGDVTFPVEIVLSSWKHQARTSSVP